MISKTIGCRGLAYFQTNPFLWCFPLLLWFFDVFWGSSPRKKGYIAEICGSLEFQGNTCWKPWDLDVKTHESSPQHTLTTFIFGRCCSIKSTKTSYGRPEPSRRKWACFSTENTANACFLRRSFWNAASCNIEIQMLSFTSFSFLSKIKFPLSKSLLRNKVVSLLRRQRARRCRGCPAHRDAFRAFSWLVGSFGTKQSFWRQRGGRYVAWSQVLLGSAKDVMKPISIA